MKKSLLAASISAALLMTGCESTDTASLSTPGADIAQESTGTAPASGTTTLNLGVRFPNGSAEAAFIDANTAVIGVKVVRVSVASWNEVDMLRRDCENPPYYDQMNDPLQSWPMLQVCTENGYAYSSYYDGNQYQVNIEQHGLDFAKMPAAATAMLTPAAPTTSVNLLPGNYVVMAGQFDSELGLYGDGSPLAFARSLAVLPEGSHNVALTMLHAAWRFVDAQGAAAPVNLRLLNNPDLMASIDADGDSANGIQPVDWDLGLAGAQSAAEALHLGTSGTLNGIDLIGAGFYQANFGPIESLYSGPNIPDWWYYDMDVTRMQNLDHIPRLVVGDGSGGQVGVMPFVTGGQAVDGTGSLAFSYPTSLLSSYNPLDGNTNNLQLLDAEVRVSTMEYNSIEFDAGLFAIDQRMDAPTVSGTTYNYPMDSWSAEEEGDLWINGPDYVTDVNGVEHTLYSTYNWYGSDTATSPTSDPSLDSYDPSTLADGATMTGTLVEYVMTGTLPTFVPTTPVPPSVEPTIAASEGGVGGDVASVVARAVALEQAARKAGLKASAAGTYGADCTTLNNTSIHVDAPFVWDTLVGGWTPGERNWSYMVSSYFDGVTETFYAGGEDIDSDGVVEIVEGAAWNQSLRAQWIGTDGTGNFLGNANRICLSAAEPAYQTAGLPNPDPMEPERFVCYYEIGAANTGNYQLDQTAELNLDLDGDGLVEEREAILLEEQRASTIEVCLHPFTLKAGQLTFTTSDTSVVIAGE